MSGVGSSPALATCETRKVLLAGVSGGFPGVLPFRPTYRLVRLYETNNLERDVKLNQNKINKKNYSATVEKNGTCTGVIPLEPCCEKTGLRGF